MDKPRPSPRTNRTRRCPRRQAPRRTSRARRAGSRARRRSTAPAAAARRARAGRCPHERCEQRRRRCAQRRRRRPLRRRRCPRRPRRAARGRRRPPGGRRRSRRSVRRTSEAFGRRSVRRTSEAFGRRSVRRTSEAFGAKDGSKARGATATAAARGGLVWKIAAALCGKLQWSLLHSAIAAGPPAPRPPRTLHASLRRSMAQAAQRASGAIFAHSSSSAESAGSREAALAAALAARARQMRRMRPHATRFAGPKPSAPPPLRAARHGSGLLTDLRPKLQRLREELRSANLVAETAIIGRRNCYHWSQKLLCTAVKSVTEAAAATP